MKKANKGITLIALVVTIIILIILAGITIGTLTSDKGVIKEAKTAKEKTEKAGVEEQIELAIIKAKQKYRNPTLDKIIEEIKNNGVISDASQVDRKTGAVTSDLGYVIEGKLDAYIITTLQPGEIVTGGNKEYTKNGTAKIPEGFAIVPGLDDVSQGLVISDVPNDTANTGNQFVWIPVTSESEYVRNTTYASTNVSAKAIDDTDYLPEGITDEKKAVVEAGGFYIGRYEAGKEGTDTLVCKKGATVWTNIAQTDAKAKAKTSFINNSNVKSALISGIQWDVAMAFINGKTDGTGEETYDATIPSDARHIGSSVAKSGQNEADRVCNIYDLEGNAWEYIAERNTYNTNAPSVNRGGSYDNSNSASNRNIDDGRAYSNNTFRLALYVKQN